MPSEDAQGAQSATGAPTNGTVTQTSVPPPTAEPSAAEKKRLKKAEKQAKRAQAKEGQGAPLPDQKSEPNGALRSAQQQQQKGNTTSPAQKSQPAKRRGSTSKQLPVRLSKEATEKPIKPSRQRDNKQVALFGHLYGHPRRTTLDHASKDVHPAVLALGLKMSSYAICGSTARCVAMLLAFRQVIESYSTPPGTSLPRHLTTHLSPQIEYLVSCRPLATSMGNAIRWLKLVINDVDPDTEEESAKCELCYGIDSFIQERITAAGLVIANAAQEKIRDGDVIMTFGKSKIVQQTFVEALKKGRAFKVIVIDSRPLHEGKAMARSLTEVGIDVTYSTTHSISHLVHDATKVFLGAHSMLGNGRLYARAGSALVAMMARDADIPVIVCCESIKFTDRVALDSIVMNEVAPAEELMLQGEDSTNLNRWKEAPNLQILNLMYDVTPAEYISSVITETGSLPSTSVPVVHRISTNT